jgi:putative CocE/NonD family hydrolase
MTSNVPTPSPNTPTDPTGRARNCRFVRHAIIPMRDGVNLAATLFLPLATGRYPVVLQRTPYGRLDWADGGDQWALAGYVFICQDTRGRYDSDGTFAPYLQEVADTPDTIAWIRQQPWCDGRVAMVGPSYLGLVQTVGVGGGGGPVPDALLPTFMPCDPWLRGFYNSGPMSFFLTFWWLCFDVGSRQQHGVLMKYFDLPELCTRLPIATLNESCGAGTNPVWRAMMAHDSYDAYWRAYSVRGQYHRFTMPTLQVCGWYDYYPAEMIFNWNAMRAAAATPEIAAGHKLLLGPWGHHHDLAPTEDGKRAVDFGPEAGFDYRAIYRSWCDRIFKGIYPADGLGDRPIRLFVMGRNVWRDEDEWPLARTRFEDWFLHSGGHANTLHGDGRLEPRAPTAEAADQFTYDPADPVPTRGGNHSVGPWNSAYKDYIWCGPCDQRPNEERPDMLVYTSAPLPEDLELTGPITLTLWASSSAPDTDFVARLVDVYADGRAINITEGVVRARYRLEDWEHPQCIEPGVPLEYRIDLQCTSNVFMRGHCLRLEVTSSCFPLWDRNLNTGEHPNTGTRIQVAHQQILHDPAHRSHLRLPVIPPR